MRPGNAGLLRSFWSPRNLPGNTLWLRGDLGVTVVSGTHVSLWKDQSGHGFDVSQAVDGSRLTTGGTIGSNGRAALQANGSQFLENTSNLLAAGAARTVLAVIRASGTGGSVITLRRGNTYSSSAYYFPGADFVSNDGVNGAQNCTLAATPMNTSDAYCAWEFSGSGNAPTFEMNGVARAVASGVQGTETGTAGFSVGGTTTTLPFSGVIGEVIVCAGVLGAADLSLWRSYVTSFFGNGF